MLHGPFIPLVAFLVTVIAGIVSVRARLMGANGGVVPQTTTRLVLSNLAAVLTIAVIVWAVLTFPWYQPLIALLTANIVIIALVSNGVWPSLCRCVPALEVIVVILGFALWIWYWPFPLA